MPKQVSVSELQRRIEELETERGLFYNIVFTVFLGGGKFSGIDRSCNLIPNHMCVCAQTL